MAQLISILAQIADSLKPILIRAIPTFLLVIALHWYLKKVIVQPIERVLAERKKRTEGAVAASEAALVDVNAKLVAYEKALYEARAGVYAEQEQNRRNLQADQAAAVEAAKQKMAAQVAAASAQIAEEAATARASLAGESERLADQITAAVLTGRN
jgi:F0F1-type ATP synthase membrane subunit b/b'